MSLNLNCHFKKTGGESEAYNIIGKFLKMNIKSMSKTEKTQTGGLKVLDWATEAAKTGAGSTPPNRLWHLSHNLNSHFITVVCFQGSLRLH